MKSTITEPQTPEITYPCLMQSPKGMIVLFTSATKGTVVHEGDTHPILGKYGDSWTPAASDPHWTRFNGTLNLSNS